MKSFTTLTAAFFAASSVQGHYIFQQLSKGATQFPVYENIRKNTNYNSPVTDLASNDLRCNVGATGNGTSTVAIAGGDSFTFTLDTAVYHQGPVSVYMSKAPTTAVDYDGSGDWFKIHDEGPTFSGSSSTWPMRQSYTYNIPTCLPTGEYLLRIQQLAIHNPGGLPQFYISCAQVSVTGTATKTPSPTAKIPGFISATDPGYTANIYNNFTNYTIPGPAVITC